MREITPLRFDREGGGGGRVLLLHPSGLQAHEGDHDPRHTLRDTPTSSRSDQTAAPAGRLGVGVVVASTDDGTAALWRAEDGAEHRGLLRDHRGKVQGWHSRVPQFHM